MAIDARGSNIERVHKVRKNSVELRVHLKKKILIKYIRNVLYINVLMNCEYKWYGKHVFYIC